MTLVRPGRVCIHTAWSWELLLGSPESLLPLHCQERTGASRAPQCPLLAATVWPADRAGTNSPLSSGVGCFGTLSPSSLTLPAGTPRQRR